jgi:hypothetical protein
MSSRLCQRHLADAGFAAEQYEFSGASDCVVEMCEEQVQFARPPDNGAR